MFSIVRKKCTVATDYTKDTFMMKKGKEGGWKSWNGNIFFFWEHSKINEWILKIKKIKKYMSFRMLPRIFRF